MEENTKANYTGKNGSLLKTKNQVNFQSTAQKGPTSLNEISLSSLLTYLIQLGICLLKFGSLQGSHSFYIFLQYTSSPEVLFYIIGRSKNMH